MEYPKLSTIVQYWINCKVNANETDLLAIARAHSFEIAFSYPAQLQIRVLVFISQQDIYFILFSNRSD
jgi:hypothetical protein